MTQVVIDIPENIYDTIIDNKMMSLEQMAVLEKQIYCSTPLPKGHGRLCDLDAALKCMEEVADDKSNIKECAMGFFDWACSKRVVLGADKEASE